MLHIFNIYEMYREVTKGRICVGWGLPYMRTVSPADPHRGFR